MSLLERVQLRDGFTAEDLNRLQTNIERALRRDRDFTTNSITNIVIGDVLADGDKGDITVSGSGAVWTIDNDVVTFAKMQNIATDRLIGRDTAGSGDPEELTVAGGLEFTGALGIQRSALTGDVTAAAGSNATAFRAFLATSVLANATGVGAVPTELSASANNQVLQRVAGVLAFAQLDYSQISGTPTLYYQTIQDGAGASLTQRTAWRASTGLTAADAGGVRTDVTVNLSTGIAGGQSAIGGTAASQNLTLSSTAHSTKGQIRLGSATYYFDEAAGTLNLGAATPGAARVIASSSQDTDVYVAVANANGGTSVSATLYASTTEDLSGAIVGVRQYGTAYPTIGLLGANVSELFHSGANTNLLITQGAAAGDIVFTTTGSRTERARIASGGNVSIANLAAGGIVKATAGTGVLAIAAVGTDYFYQTIQNAGTPLTQRAAWNASTGLTAVDNGGSSRTDVTVNLSTGLAGGQTAYGGTAASEFLHLSSTTHATKGHLVFGAPGAVSGFNESIGQLYVGGAGALSTAPFAVTSSSDSTIHHMIGNTSTGTAARTGLFVGQQTSAIGGSYVEIFTYGSLYTVSGLIGPGVGEILHVGASNFLIGAFTAAADIIFYTTGSRTERMRVATGGNISVANLTAGGVVYATAATGVLKIGTAAEVAATITWPTAGQVLVSSGTTTAPVGDVHFTYDTATDLLSINAGGTQAWYNLDGATNYERVRASWGLVANTWILKSEAGGTGTVRAMQLEGSTASVVIQSSGATGFVAFGQSFGVNPDIVGDLDRITLRGTQSIASAASVTLDVVKFDMSGITVTGATHVTDVGGVNAVFFPGAIYNGTGGAKTIDYAATVKIGDGPDDTGDLTIANKYALWVDAGAVRFDAGVLGALVNKSSAANLSVKPTEANVAEVTGATTVHTMWTGNDTNVDAWTYGSIVHIVCETTGFTLKHNGTGAADYAVFDLSGNVDYVMAAGDTLTVYYTGAVWKEIGRSAA